MTLTQIKNIAKLISEDPKMVALLTEKENVSTEHKSTEESKVSPPKASE